MRTEQGCTVAQGCLCDTSVQVIINGADMPNINFVNAPTPVPPPPTPTPTPTPSPTSITVVSPNGGEKWVRGTTQTIRWTYTGSPGTYVKIELLKAGVLNRVIISSTLNDGSHPWLIPATQAPGNDYKVKITSTTKPVYNDISDKTFTIPVPSFTVVSPNGGESWVRGTTKTIKWNSTESPGSYVKIELLKPGVANKLIVSSTLNDGSHNWLIPATQTPGNDYKVKITSTTNASNNDTSNASFTIPAPSITVVSPNNEEKWRRGTTQTIRWNSTESPGSYVKIELFKAGIWKSTIISSTLNDGSHSWLIPATMAPGTDYKVKVTSTINPVINDASDNNFIIPIPSFTVVTPNGGEKWIKGTTRTISWNSTESPGSYVKIELLKPGVANKLIISSTLNDGSHPWLIPATQVPGNDYKVKVTSTINASNNDISDNNFTISSPITVVSPDGGEIWQPGTKQVIRWNYTGNPGQYVKIELFKGGKFNRTISSNRSIGSGGSGFYNWTIPSTQALGTDYRVRITSTANSAYTDTSNGIFSITSAYFQELPVAFDSINYINWYGNTEFAYLNRNGIYSQTQGLHSGIDFVAPYGISIKGTINRNGMVVSIDNEQYDYKTGPGNLLIDYGDFLVLYGHTQKSNYPDKVKLSLAEKTAIINSNDIIAYIGSDGNLTHLHLEVIRKNPPESIRPGDIRTNPIPFFSSTALNQLKQKAEGVGAEFHPILGETKWQTPEDQPDITPGGPLLVP